jgi:hypothetical protein
VSVEEAPKKPRGPFCAVCEKTINTEEGHYRSGLAWFHLDCYEEFEKKPTKKPRDR